MTLSERLRREAYPSHRAGIHADDARATEPATGCVEADIWNAAFAPMDWAWSLVWLLEWIRRGR